MEYKIKKEHLFLFFLVAIVLMAVSYFSYKEAVRKNSLSPILAYHLSCESGMEKIDQAILNLRRDTILIGAYIEFDQLPYDQATKEVLEKGEIYLDDRTQLFEISPKVYARIPRDSMCDLVALESVKYISIPETKIKKDETK